MFTDINFDNIEKIKGQNINELKVLLANEATAMLHGKIKSSNAEKTAIEVFQKGLVGKDVPIIQISKRKIDNGINIIDFILLSNLLFSKSEIRRAIKNKGIKINNNSIDDDKIIIDQSFFLKNACKVSFGKKRHAVIKLN